MLGTVDQSHPPLWRVKAFQLIPRGTRCIGVVKRSLGLNDQVAHDLELREQSRTALFNAEAGNSGFCLNNTYNSVVFQWCPEVP